MKTLTMKNQMNESIKTALIYLTILSVLSFTTACQHKVEQSTNKSQTTTPQSWKLNSEYSSISIITTKNNSKSEVSNFTKFSGGIKSNGEFSIVIDLKSLETNIPVRNERIQKHLFNTDTYPTAEIHTLLKPDDLTIGVHNISFDVDLHGLSSIMSAEFMVFEQYGNKIITLHKPLIINASTFGLENGITTLKNIAKLQNISFTVPLNLTLSFEVE